jgi:lysyl-tRNA synthetase class 2
MTGPGGQRWRPGLNRVTLALRAALLRRTRDFFAARTVLEVETPVLGRHTASAVHIESLQTVLRGYRQPFYLQTSPEYHMKRLLAAGSGDIYQISRVFRDGEAGRRHNPEFTLLEWYRTGMPYLDLATEVCELLACLLDDAALSLPECIRYDQALKKFTGLDTQPYSAAQLSHVLDRGGIPVPDDHRGGELLDLVFTTLVAPELGKDRPVVIYQYPAEQAALARLCPDEADRAERFEVFYRGMELANGYRELLDADEQLARFLQDQDLRRVAGRDPTEPDDRLIAALAHGLPDCSGVAMGFDRVVMLAAATDNIGDVLAFDTDRA